MNDRALDNPINWSFRVGRIWDITIRVHIAFVLCAVFLIWMEIPRDGGAETPPLGRMFAGALGTYAILFGIVLFHEFGHCFGCRKVGGEADEILIWPLGGLAQVSPPHNPGAHMFTTLAGPTVNVIICALCSAALVLWTGSLGAVPWNPLHPFTPADEFLPFTAGQEWLLRVYGVSYFILLINLLPIYPFDGGRVLQAWMWPRRGYAASIETATGVGMIGAIVIGLSSLFMAQDWMLMMIAVFGYVTCWQTRRLLREQGEFGFLEREGGVFAGGHTFFEEPEIQRRPGYFERRRARKLAERAEQERRAAEERERAVEEILRKVSQSGIASLTPQERAILEEETQRRRMSRTQ